MNAVKPDKYEEGKIISFCDSYSVNKANGCGF
jgi:hypothetical protein